MPVWYERMDKQNERSPIMTNQDTLKPRSNEFEETKYFVYSRGFVIAGTICWVAEPIYQLEFTHYPGPVIRPSHNTLPLYEGRLQATCNTTLHGIMPPSHFFLDHYVPTMNEHRKQSLLCKQYPN
jgi:hypothetical protein